MPPTAIVSTTCLALALGLGALALVVHRQGERAEAGRLESAAVLKQAVERLDAATAAGARLGEDLRAVRSLAEAQEKAGRVALAEDYGCEHRLQMVRWGDGGMGVIRWNRHTGKSDYLKNGKWQEIRELDGAAPSPGRFQVEMTDVKTDWAAVRLDQRSGESWYAIRGVWQPCGRAEPPAR